MSIKIQDTLFGCEPQVFLISNGGNDFSVPFKFLLAGFLNAEPCCILHLKKRSISAASSSQLNPKASYLRQA